MTLRMTATEARAKFFALLVRVERGEEIEVTRRGRMVARILPAKKQLLLKDRHAGQVTINAAAEELFSTGVQWEAQDPEQSSK